MQDDVASEAETGKIYRSNYKDKHGRPVLVMRPRCQVGFSFAFSFLGKIVCYNHIAYDFLIQLVNWDNNCKENEHLKPFKLSYIGLKATMSVSFFLCYLYYLYFMNLIQIDYARLSVSN